MNDIISAFFSPIIELLPKLPAAVLDFLLGYLLIVIVMFFLRRFLKLIRMSASIKHLILSAINILLWIFLGVYILDYLGLSRLIVAFTGSAVLIGFVLNNGLSQSISDIFSGMSLSNDKDFKIGIRISINEGKTVGKIVSLSPKKVKLIDDDGYVHIIPNSLFDKNEWIILEEKEKKNASNKSKK